MVALVGTSKFCKKLAFASRVMEREFVPSEKEVMWPTGPKREELNAHSRVPLFETSTYGVSGKLSGVRSKGLVRAPVRVPWTTMSTHALSTIAWLSSASWQSELLPGVVKSSDLAEEPSSHCVRTPWREGGSAASAVGAKVSKSGAKR